MQGEIQTFTEQEDALAAPAWYTQVTPDNINKVDELYSIYDRVSSTVQEAVKEECKDRVDAVQLLKFDDAGNAFMIDSTYELDDTQTTLHCSVDVPLAGDTMKTELEAFQATDLTLKVQFNESRFVPGTPDHAVDDVATATTTKGERVSVGSTLPFDTSWSSHYKVEVTKYFPSM